MACLTPLLLVVLGAATSGRAAEPGPARPPAPGSEARAAGARAPARPSDDQINYCLGYGLGLGALRQFSSTCFLESIVLKPGQINPATLLEGLRDGAALATRPLPGAGDTRGCFRLVGDLVAADRKRHGIRESGFATRMVRDLLYSMGARAGVGLQVLEASHDPAAAGKGLRDALAGRPSRLPALAAEAMGSLLAENLPWLLEPRMAD
jgi:hypothetical protein